MERGVGLGVDATRAHEGERALDLGGHLLVTLTLGARGDEFLVPRVHAVEVGETTLGERAHEIQRARGLVVRLHESLGVGHA